MKVLLHTCCGVCASHCADLLLSRGDEVVLFYSNANIFPHEEFLRRLEGAEKLASHYKIPLIVDAPNHAEWRERVACGFENEPERGARCPRCFRYALLRTADAMERLNCDMFTTSLSVSPHKSSKIIFETGKSIDSGRFLEIDFKKKNGFRHSLEISSSLGIYRQCYCGCEFSVRRTAPVPQETGVPAPRG